MSVDRMREQLKGKTAELDPDQARKAALFVASKAADVEERAELLRMLGLLDPGFRWVHRLQGGTRGRRKIMKEAS